MKKNLNVTKAILLILLVACIGVYLMVEAKPSAKAELINISIGGLSVSKSGDVWSATVPYSITSIDISDIISTKSEKANITYNGKTLE